MAALQQLCSVTVHHSYFADDLCRQLLFSPTPASTILISKASLLLNLTEIGFQIFYESSLDEEIASVLAEACENPIIDFQVQLRDPNFWYYTDCPTPQKDRILTFSNQSTRSLTHGGLCLHAGKYVSAKDWQQASPPQRSFSKSGATSSMFHLFLDLSLLFTPTKEQAEAHLNEFHLFFKTRETKWLYSLIGAGAQRSLTIRDKNKTFSFEELGQTTLPDGRKALQYLSTQPIPLSQQSTCNFQLREHGAGGEKILIRRLPTASPNQQRYEEINGQSTVVSDIFINC